MDAKEAIFISYAWGDSLEKKEWIRESIVSHLEPYLLSIFWDRDTILFGQRIDAVIAKALSARPLHIFCICDKDYVTSAARDGSGLYRELRMIEDVAYSKDVRITPVIVDANVKNLIPNILRDRLYVDLTALHERGIAFGSMLASIVFGATQPEIEIKVAELFHRLDVREKVNKHFNEKPVELFGDAVSHEVWINGEKLLLPPKWMYEVTRWSFRLSDDVPGFCPAKGVWHWDHWTTSTGMRALGAAACSAFFPNKTSSEQIAALERCGEIIANRFFAMTKVTEPFSLKGTEVAQILLMADGGMNALEALLE